MKSCMVAGNRALILSVVAGLQFAPATRCILDNEHFSAVRRDHRYWTVQAAYLHKLETGMWRSTSNAFLWHRNHRQFATVNTIFIFCTGGQSYHQCDILWDTQHLEEFSLCPLFILTAESEQCLTGRAVTSALDDYLKTGVPVTALKHVILQLLLSRPWHAVCWLNFVIRLLF